MPPEEEWSRSYGRTDRQRYWDEIDPNQLNVTGLVRLTQRIALSRRTVVLVPGSWAPTRPPWARPAGSERLRLALHDQRPEPAPADPDPGPRRRRACLATRDRRRRAAAACGGRAAACRYRTAGQSGPWRS